MPRLAVMCDW